MSFNFVDIVLLAAILLFGLGFTSGMVIAQMMGQRAYRTLSLQVAGILDTTMHLAAVGDSRGVRETELIGDDN